MTGQPYRILVTGSRNWEDRQTLIGALMDAIGDRHAHQVVVVHGGAAGADMIADEFATKLGCQVRVYRPDWEHCDTGCPPRRHRKAHSNGVEYCPAAGHRRNQRMVDAGADVALAFIRAGSKGASDCAGRAETAGIPTKRYTA